MISLLGRLDLFSEASPLIERINNSSHYQFFCVRLIVRAKNRKKREKPFLKSNGNLCISVSFYLARHPRAAWPKKQSDIPKMFDNFFCPEMRETQRAIKQRLMCVKISVPLPCEGRFVWIFFCCGRSECVSINWQ